MKPCLLILLICVACPLLPAQDSLTSINGTQLYIEVSGEGEPIVVIHGGPLLDHGYLQPSLDRLSNDYRLIYFDQRVSGRSTSDVDSLDITMRNFIADIDGILDERGLESAHILGHSWGGLLAMEYAIRHPNRTRSLILLSSMAPSASLWRREEQIQADSFTEADSIERAAIMQSELLQQDPPEAVGQLLMLSLKKQFHNPDLADSLTLYVPDDYMKRSALFSKLGSYLFSYDLMEPLKQLRLPVLLVYGEDEPAATLSGRFLKETLQGSTMVIIPEAGHFPFIEQPEAFDQAVLEFLEDK